MGRLAVRHTRLPEREGGEGWWAAEHGRAGEARVLPIRKGGEIIAARVTARVELPWRCKPETTAGSARLNGKRSFTQAPPPLATHTYTPLHLLLLPLTLPPT